jgi:hypothetical protein
MGTHIEPARLSFDLENPRIPFQDNLGQREALLALAKDQDGGYLLGLAADITAFGLSPAELPIVTPSVKELGRFVVLDGNRRLTALRSLENPESVASAIRPGILELLRKESVRYHSSPIKTVECVVVKSKKDAEHWIFLRHNGRSSGAGTLDWGPHEKARFRATASGKVDLDTKLLDFLEEGGYLQSEDRKRVPASNFRRLIETKAILAKLGIEVGKDGSFRFHDEPGAISGLLYIVNDLASKATKVTDIYTKEQRGEYASKIPASIVSIANEAQSSGRDHNAKSLPADDAVSKRTPVARIRAARDRLIPSSCFLKVTDARVRKIENELRGLEFKDYSNAIAVLFRVFLELSVDHYRSNTLNRRPDAVRQIFSNKMIDALTYMEQNQILDQQQAKPVRAATEQSLLNPSIALMHEYVHNLQMNPSPTDLRAAWDNLQPFIVALWPPKK